MIGVGSREQVPSEHGYLCCIYRNFHIFSFRIDPNPAVLSVPLFWHSCPYSLQEFRLSTEKDFVQLDSIKLFRITYNANYNNYIYMHII